jgi:hypothetical protein
VLNLEPRGVSNGKEFYWNGPTDPRGVRDQYLSPLLQHAPREALELACIPRDWVIGALGGPETLRTWLEHVGSASWECYDVIAPQDLNPDVAMPRVERCMPSVAGPDFRIIIVQQSRIDAWAGGHWAVPGLQVWHLDGDWDLAPGVWPQKSEKGADPEREPGARPAEAETS